MASNSLTEAQQQKDPCLSAIERCNGLIYSAVLKAALELNLFEIIAKAGESISATEIASKFPTQQLPDLPQRLERMLRLLVSQSLLTCSKRTNQDGSRDKKLYELSPVGKYFVKDHSGGFLGLFPAFHTHRGVVDTLLNFKDVILDADSDLFKKSHGIPIYEYIKTDPALNYIFNTSMANSCILETKRILEMYRGLEGIRTLVDVGGGTGQNLKMIISKYPSIKGINFDLPQVIQNVPPYSGIEHVGGDMFASVPQGEAIILKTICHNWSDENCLKLLSNCKNALTEKGKVIVVDFIMPETIEETEEAKVVTSLDNLALTYGGRERTDKEFETLCEQSGFSGFKVVCSVFSVLGVMEFYK